MLPARPGWGSVSQSSWNTSTAWGWWKGVEYFQCFFVVHLKLPGPAAATAFHKHSLELRSLVAESCAARRGWKCVLKCFVPVQNPLRRLWAGGFSKGPGGDLWLLQGQDAAPSLEGLLHSLSQCASRFSCSLLAKTQAALHREVKSNSVFMKWEQNVPKQHKTLPFFLYWHSQEELMFSLDRADDCCCSLFIISRLLCLQIIWLISLFSCFAAGGVCEAWYPCRHLTDCEAENSRTFGDKTTLNINWPLMFMDWCAVILHCLPQYKLSLPRSLLEDLCCFWEEPVPVMGQYIECNFTPVLFNVHASAPVQYLPGWGSNALKL